MGQIPLLLHGDAVPPWQGHRLRLLRHRVLPLERRRASGRGVIGSGSRLLLRAHVVEMRRACLYASPDSAKRHRNDEFSGGLYRTLSAAMVLIREKRNYPSATLP